MLCKNFLWQDEKKARVRSKYLQTQYLTKNQYQKHVKSSQSSVVKTQNSPIRKWSKDLKRQIHKVNALIKRSSTSLVLREMQNKTTISYHYIPLRMATLKNSGSTECWRGGRKTGLVMCWWWEYKTAPATIENSLAIS